MDGFLINTGRKQFLLVSSLIILVSLYTIGFYVYFSFSYKNFFNNLKFEIAKEIFYLIIITCSLASIKRGYKWIIYFLIILFSSKTYYALKGISWTSINSDISGRFTNYYISNFKVVIYCISILFFCFSKSFKEYIKYQKTKFTRVQSSNN